MLGLWAKLQAMLQAMLQAILQAAGPVVYYYKVLKGRFVKRDFRACWPLFLGVPGFSFLGVSWAFVFGSSFLEWSTATRPTVAYRLRS